MLLNEYTVSGDSPIGRLVKPSLDFDSDSQEFRRPKGYNQIVAFTHGTSVAAIGRLARHGQFVRASSAENFLPEFYTNPNPTYRNLGKIGMLTEDVQKVRGLKVDALRLGLEYASGSGEEVDDGGVVVVVRPEILRRLPYKLHIGSNEDYDDVPEVILLQGSPSMDEVEGIYPATQEAAQNLKELLQLA